MEAAAMLGWGTLAKVLDFSLDVYLVFQILWDTCIYAEHLDGGMVSEETCSTAATVGESRRDWRGLFDGGAAAEEEKSDGRRSLRRLKLSTASLEKLKPPKW